MSERTIKPFANGDEFSSWEDACCGRCTKSSINSPIEMIDSLTTKIECEIEEALDFAYWDDGKISETIALRMGGTKEEEWKFFLRPCTEYQCLEKEK